MPVDADTPVQVSLFNQEARGPGAPNEKSVLLVLHQVARRFAQGDYLTDGGESGGGISVVFAEAGVEDDFAEAWVNFWPRDADLDDPETWVFGPVSDNGPTRCLC